MKLWPEKWRRYVSEKAIVATFVFPAISILLPMLTLDNFEDEASPEIVKRGHNYFLNGAVTYLEEEEDSRWEAEVDGSETYHLDISLKGRTNHRRLFLRLPLRR